MKEFRLFLVVISLAMPMAVWAERQDIGITIYNQNFGVVKEIRALKLEDGLNTISLQDVAAHIDPTSVKFVSLTDPKGTQVLEQNFEYDLVSQSKLLQKYIDKEIVLEAPNQKDYDWKRKKATYLGNDIFKVGEEIQLGFPGIKILPALPEGLITKPTLVWLLDAKKRGRHEAKITYITNNLNWYADYTLVAKKDDKMIDLSGWVTIDNKSGASYKDANIKFVAGDVHKLAPGLSVGGYPTPTSVREKEARAPQFAEKGFAEYHLYTLQRRSTVKENEIKQIELLNSININSKKVYLYRGAKFAQYQYYGVQDPRYGTESNKKINVMLEFMNSKKVAGNASSQGKDKSL